MKDIKDCIHLYLGQDVKLNEKHTEAPRVVLSGIYYAQDQGGYWPDAARCQLFTHPGENILWLRLDEFKLLLRPLLDISDNEAKELLSLNEDGGEIHRIFKKTNGGLYFKFRNDSMEYCKYYGSLNPPQFCYLLSKGFDLFGLCDAGLAVDRTKMGQGTLSS